MIREISKICIKYMLGGRNQDIAVLKRVLIRRVLIMSVKDVLNGHSNPTNGINKTIIKRSVEGNNTRKQYVFQVIFDLPHIT